MSVNASSTVKANKAERFNSLQQDRKIKREEMMMKRRGLNFVTEHHEELL